MQKKHPWPTRWNEKRGRYEVKVNGSWVSAQRASFVWRRLAGRREARRADK